MMNHQNQIKRTIIYLFLLVIITLTYSSIQLYYQVEILNYKLDKINLQITLLDYKKYHYIINTNPNKIYREQEKIWN